MNDMKELEAQLRSWVPRRPSAKLERRLFARQAAPAVASYQPPVTHHLGFRLRWVAPATAALVLLCVLYNQRAGDSFGGGTNSRHIVAMILSNQSAIAYLPAGFQRDQNSPPADTFEWTNGSGSTSSMRSLSAPKVQD